MKTKFSRPVLLLTALSVSSLALYAFADDDDERSHWKDFGQFVEQALKANAEQIFGINRPLNASAPLTVGPYRTATQTANDQVLLAGGLRAAYLTRNAADSTDMLAFFPANNPTHLISCVEGGRQVINAATGKLNPSVQRINLQSGAVDTILRGMISCDGIRTTPWGTILATEETSDGGAYEILNPLMATNQSVLDRATGAVTDSVNIAKRTALPRMAWEGLEILPNGIVYAGDELRPGTGTPDIDGGAIFKFIPTSPYSGGAAFTNLSQSPFVFGAVYAMQVSCVNSAQQYGQGCEIGNAAWLRVSATTPRADAARLGATGYYRPEDLHGDPMYKDRANPSAVRFCWSNTGNEDAQNYAEVVCAVDKSPQIADASTRTVTVNRFIEGDTDFNSFDNLAFQPGTGHLYVIEDHPNGDIFACLQDGGDRDIKSDGCVKILSVKDSSAEPTGFIFSPDGRTAYVSLQHSNDANMAKVDDYATDDLIVVTGFKVRR
jgi:Bacterial protein of unknown function (DUF839)